MNTSRNICFLVLLTSAVIILPAISQAQTLETKEDVIKAYFDTAKSLSSKYYCDSTQAENNNGKKIMVHPKAFNLLARSIFSNVIVGSNDLVQNTSAASFVQDEDKGTLNINYSYLKENIIYNAGVFAKAKDGVFGIYTNNSWNSDIGFNTGVSFAKAGQYFIAKDCEKLKVLRYHYLTQRVNSHILLIRNYNTTDLIKRKKELLNLIDLNAYDNVDTFEVKTADYKKYQEALQKTDSLLKELRRIYPKNITPKHIDTTLVNEIVTFDTSNKDLFRGYNVHWFGISIALSNNTINASNENLPEEIKKDFSVKNLIKATLSLNYNRAHLGKKAICFFKGGVDIGVTNALNHPSINKQPIIKFDSSSSVYNIYSADDEFIAAYSDIKPNIITFNPNIYVSIFFLAEKNIGIDARMNIVTPIKASTIVYESTFNITTGPIFRINAKDGYSKGTIGVEVGLMNAEFNSQVWDGHFGAKLKIGLPFNVFLKENKE